MYLLFLFFLFLNFKNIFIDGKVQKIEVRGRILCQGKPIPYLKIKLKEEDFFVDDILNENMTNEDGTFKLHGNDDEIFKITPYIQFTYTCCEYFEHCQHDTKVLFVPDNVISISKDKTFYHFQDIDFHKPLDILK